jgi:hypothetical protein
MNHERCRKAVLKAPYGITWACCQCGARLASCAADGKWPLVFEPGLHARPHERWHDGVKTYGLSDAARLRGEPVPKDMTGANPLKGREFYVYCLGPGCGAGQHISVTPPIPRGLPR